MMKKCMRKMGAPILLASCLYAGAANARSYKWDTPPYAEDYAFITNDGGWCWFSDPRAEWVIAHQPEGNIDITKGKSNRWWCDALYMAPAVYSRLYALTGNPDFMKFAHKEFKATCDHLYDKEEKLFFRGGNYLGKKEANGEKVSRGRGNGWVMGGLAELLKTLPEKDKKYRPYYLALFLEMSKRVATRDIYRKKSFCRW